MKKLPIKNILNFHPELKGSEGGVLERKGLTTDFNTNDLNEFESIGILSTPSVDAEGDILDPDGMDTSIFNGVVIFNHDLGELPVGSITEIKKSKEGVTGKFKFSETYAFAQDCFNLIKEKILRGISVGYLPMKVYKKGTTAFNELAKAKGWATAGVERIVAEWQLIEVSVCNVGCNSDALLLASKSFKSELAFKNFKIETKGCKEEEIKEVDEDKVVDQDNVEAVTEEVTEATEAIAEVADTQVEELPVQETPDILIVEESLVKEVKVDVVSDEVVGPILPIEPDVEIIPTSSEVVPEVIEEPIVKALVLNVLRKGKMPITEEIKRKAKLFIQGKSF